MWRSLLSSGCTGVGRRGDASGRTTPSGPTGIALRVLATEREPFRAQAKTSHAIHVLLQGAEETHFCRWCYVSLVVFYVSADSDFSSDRTCRRLLSEFFLGSLLGTELPRCASKSTGIDLAEGRLDTVRRLTHHEQRSSNLGNFYGTSSRRNIDSRLWPFVTSL